jgi:catechol 2,3-dioxygenase-like lactoylglutathione lyase family enzyme
MFYGIKLVISEMASLMKLSAVKNRCLIFYCVSLNGSPIRRLFKFVEQVQIINMKAIPVIKCKDMEKSLAFYTSVLDFELKYKDASPGDWVIDLVNGDAEIQLSILGGDGSFGSAVNIRVEDVDGLFRKYTARGLDTSGKKESPVHQAPLDQSWGMREFYVDDPNGNTLRFGKTIE